MIIISVSFLLYEKLKNPVRFFPFFLLRTASVTIENNKTLICLFIPVGIPFSDDMGIGRESTCPAEQFTKEETVSPIDEKFNLDTWSARHMYEEMGLMEARLFTSSNDSIEKLQQEKDKPDKGTKWLPLVYQEFNQTRIVEQPVDFTTLAEKYSNFATSFIENNKDSPNPFFLYVPFSHVHTTEAGTTTENQYVGCKYRNSTKRGIFGDALAETDWITGNIVQKVRDLGLEEDTLILFTSDNGPWAMRGSSAGSEGLFTGRFAEGYKNTAKGSNWVNISSFLLLFIFNFFSEDCLHPAFNSIQTLIPTGRRDTRACICLLER